jgi:hypothetical protein
MSELISISEAMTLSDAIKIYNSVVFLLYPGYMFSVTEKRESRCAFRAVEPLFLIFPAEAVFLYPWKTFSEFVNVFASRGFCREEGYIHLPPFMDWKERFAVLKSRPMSMFFKVTFPTILLVALQQDTVVAADFKTIARVNSQISNVENLRRLSFRIRTSAKRIARFKGGADGPGGVRFYPGDNGMRH